MVVSASLFSRRFVRDFNLYDVVEISYKRVVPTNSFGGFSIFQIVFPVDPTYSQRFCLSSLWQLAAHHLLCDDAVATIAIHACVTSRIQIRCTKERRLREHQMLSWCAESSLGWIWYVFHMNIKLFPQIRSVDTMGIELWISSLQPTLHWLIQ